MGHKRLLFYAALSLLLLALILVVIFECSNNNIEEIHKKVVIENTPIEIENVRPTGEIYVCSAIIEDYTTFQKTERHLGIIPEEHSCVQILRQKCSYKLNLDKVVYKKDTLNRIFVYLPELEYVASTQNSPFISDDEDFWIEAMPNTNGLKKKVAGQIRRKFDTRENRDKGNLYAKSAISALLSKLGYDAEFVSSLERRKE
ncbi:MAG: hypothetical protein K6E54_10755 [Bacteroidaceae bacterium]|nr:hypothetical protein [Bacteroidaceae bacterium]